MELAGISRVKDYEHFIENQEGFWHVSVLESSDGELDGFLASVGHPLLTILGPGVARTEAGGLALVAAELDRLRGRTVLCLVPVDRDELVRELYGWGGAQLRAARPSDPGRAPALPGCEFPDVHAGNGLTTLLTGATGFLGRHLVPLLAERGDPLRALVREGTDDAFLRPFDVAVARGDITDEEAVRRAAQGCERVFHLAGLLGYRASQRASLERINVNGVRVVLDALEPGARLVHVSSVAAVGPVDRATDRADESHPYPPRADRSLYSLTKRRGEELVLDAARNGVDAVVANPGFLLGPGDVYRVNTWPVQRYLQGTLRFLVEGGLSNVDPRDVAQGLVALADRGRAGERTILTSPTGNLSHEAFFRRVGEVTGVRRRQVVLPAKAALAAARVVPWPVRPEEVAAASDWWFFDPSKAQSRARLHDEAARRVDCRHGVPISVGAGPDRPAPAEKRGRSAAAPTRVEPRRCSGVRSRPSRATGGARRLARRTHPAPPRAAAPGGRGAR